MKILFEIIYNSDRFINILAVAITAAVDLLTLISFIKSSEKRAVKLFIIIFFTVILIVLIPSMFIRVVPDVVGDSYKEARSKILEQEFTVDEEGVSEETVVTAQNPNAGELKWIRSKIKLEYKDGSGPKDGNQSGTEKMNALLNEAQKLADSGDYLGAYNIINDFLKDNAESEELITKKTEYIQQYKEVLFAEAERLYLEFGYKEAIRYLTESLDDYEDEDIHEKIQYYKNKKPVNLLTRNTLVGEMDKFLSDYGEKTDSLGNTYSYKIECGDILKYAYYVGYVLDGEFTTLNFDLALNSEYKSSDIITTWIEIYDEDSNLLLETEHLGAGSRPISYTLDITGIEELYIYAWHTGEGEYGMKYDFALTNGFWVSK